MTETTLPIEGVIPRLKQTLRDHRNAVLVAEPGAGKTTRVPLALLDEPWLEGRKIIVLEPRRLAARAAARRMAQMLGEQAGETVGYRVRMESKVSAKTRIEVVTEGIFTRQILQDPELSDIGAVLFDEFHERSLEADLGLALALDVQQALRDDLRILPMSATLDAASVGQLLGDAPTITCEGRQFPVETRYLGRDNAQRIEDQIVRAVRTAIAEEEGSVLVFLPGQGEINRVQQGLEGKLPANVDIAPLYGALDFKAQDFAIKPAAEGRRKVVLTTSIAQTSLTIEGVRVVIDSGLTRTSNFDAQHGLSRLVTVRTSRATADQRRGRAGRTEAGVCYRLWDEAQTKALPADDLPQILESDLCGLVLDVASWGVNDPSQLSFMTPPPKAAWQEACSLLTSLDALDDKGHITDGGKALAKLPLHPRLAHMMQEAAKIDQHPLASMIAALVSEPGLGGRSIDLRDRLRALVNDSSQRAKSARALAGRWSQMVSASKGERPDFEQAGPIMAFAYPDRIAQQRGGAGRFRLASGRGGQMDLEAALSTEPFITIAEMQGSAAQGRILLAAPIERDFIEEHFASQLVRKEHVTFSPNGAIRAVRQLQLGKVVLAEEKISNPDPEAILDALVSVVSGQPLAKLPWTKDQLRLRDRVNYVRDQLGEPWPDLSDQALSDDFDWLRPFLSGLTSVNQINAQILGDALANLLPWAQMNELEQLAPAHFEAPTGSRTPILYDGPQGPRIAIRVQELFGLADHPSICDGKLPLTLELLSPAQRPIQVTRDLPGFWKGSWADVKADMKGRYPRHPWPDNPLEAEATKRAKPRKQ
ncbi:ATP-dependent helicase HrpB [Rhodobacteraceae bacterium RKSG542]|uniref:ATP-dependent helicase HrpB n=1 Tax=Pseudovibrio flavus TaxID=2529854 RepID=UPI0012BB5E55|nr:ATP-dependent helicase HrpB [Pseudovibrio flavus]MTI17220.1 ATP-dependent helicase HrpB [Pseudovibrio flavus]